MVWKGKHTFTIKRSLRDFPGGPVVKNPPSNAGDMGSIPGWGIKIPCASRQLSLHVATTDPTLSSACTPQRKILHAAVKIPHATTKI